MGHHAVQGHRCRPAGPLVAVAGVLLLSAMACGEAARLPTAPAITPAGRPATPASATLKRTVSPTDVPPPAPAPPPGPTATAAPLTTGQPGTGIEGLVTIGPMCPVVTLASPCPDRTYAAAVAVRDGSGREVARFQTGDDGRFRVEFPPGVYTLAPVDPRPGVPPRGREQMVTVVGGQITPGHPQVRLGIR